MGSQNSLVDCLTRIRNAVARGHKKVCVLKSKAVEGVLRVLQDEGYIDSWVEGVISPTGEFHAAHSTASSAESSEAGAENGEVRKIEDNSKKKSGLRFNRPAFEVTLRYFRNQKPVINEIKLISKGSRRIYSGIDDVQMVKRGLGIIIMSTNQGIISDRRARELRVGGELIAVVN